jgi:hypothetical protein
VPVSASPMSRASLAETRGVRDQRAGYYLLTAVPDVRLEHLADDPVCGDLRTDRFDSGVGGGRVGGGRMTGTARHQPEGSDEKNREANELHSAHPILIHVHGPLIWNAATPDRFTVSGPSKLLLSEISDVLVLFRVA